MRVVAGVIAAGVAVVGLGLAFVYSGLADVAATSPPWKLTEWVLSTTMENAVRRRATGVVPPGFLGDEERVRSGARAYAAMCASCHGAPGVEAEALGRGLEPAPPDLAEEAGDWAPAELFWITKHGVRMTGMPAFGPTYADEELWEIVAFLGRLPEMSPTAYRAIAAPTGSGHVH